jgi:hypothetical protein
MSFRMIIGTCNSTARKLVGKSCESIKDIEEYIKKVNVEHWVLEQTIDLGLYSPFKPV